jgi:recombination protein RecA
VEKSGAWYSFNSDRIGQGRDSAKEFLKTHPDIAKDIREKILDKAGVKRPHAPEAAPAAMADKKEKSKSR